MIDTNTIAKNIGIENYVKEVVETIHLMRPDINVGDIEAGVLWAINLVNQNAKAVVNDSYRDIKRETTVWELTQYLMSRQPIMTSYGVLFAHHEQTPSPIMKLIDSYLTKRTVYKNTMFKYPKGSEMYERYNLLQLLKKLDGNSAYGVMVNNTAFFYNLNVAQSITRQGKSSISTAILFFESFLGNNVTFHSLDDIVTFINNVVNESRTYNDHDILDEPITVEECFCKLISNCGFDGYVPSESDMQCVEDILRNLRSEDLNRLFYKNNLFSFCDNKMVTDMIVHILQALDEPFLDPNHPPEKIKDELKEFTDLLFEYVYYRHIYTDKIERAAISFKKVSVLTDTDSSLVCLDGWYRYVLGKVYNVPMKIKEQYLDEKKAMNGDNEVVDTEKGDTTERYDFFRDEFIEYTRKNNEDKIVPQDNLRFSILNIMIYCMSALCVDYMRLYSGNFFSYSDERCRLYMKNELLIKKILLMDVKKQYVSWVELQEGHNVPSSEAMKITGLTLDKSVISDEARTRLKKILKEDIFDADKIDQLKILTDLIKLEKEITATIKSGDTRYFKPAALRPIGSYTNPMVISGIKASLVYNEMCKEIGATPIDLEDRNQILLVKVDINKKNIEEVKAKDPKFGAACERLLNSCLKTGITNVAIPADESTPQWLIPFIDYYEIIQNNLSPFPLEAIGLNTGGNNSVVISNVLQL